MAKKKDQGVFSGLVGMVKSDLRRRKMEGRKDRMERVGAAAQKYGKVPSKVTAGEQILAEASGAKVKRKAKKTSASAKRTQAYSRGKARHR